MTIYACDGQTDRQNYDSQDHPRICLHGKKNPNKMQYFLHASI